MFIFRTVVFGRRFSPVAGSSAQLPNFRKKKFVLCLTPGLQCSRYCCLQMPVLNCRCRWREQIDGSATAESGGDQMLHMQNAARWVVYPCTPILSPKWVRTRWTSSIDKAKTEEWNAVRSFPLNCETHSVRIPKHSAITYFNLFARFSMCFPSLGLGPIKRANVRHCMQLYGFYFRSAPEYVEYSAFECVCCICN